MLTGSANSNDAIQISLVNPAPDGVKQLHAFHPKMTYSIFDEESIFGYQGLKINLRYNASDMRPGLQITYNKRFKAVGETAPTDIKAILEEYLPKSELPLMPSHFISLNLLQWRTMRSIWGEGGLRPISIRLISARDGRLS